MLFFSEQDRQTVRQHLASVTQPVTLLLFTQTIGCETCGPARQLLTELAELSEKLSLEEHNLVLETDVAASHGVTRAPAIVVASNGNARIRFFGAPHGYEFMSLLDAIQLVGGGRQSDLSDETRRLLATVDKPVNIQVFVTPT